MVSRWRGKGGRERRAGGPFPRGHSPFFVFPHFRVHDDAISAFPAHQPFLASGTRRIPAISRRELRAFPRSGLRIPQEQGAMAAHSACAIRGGVVTVRRAPPARLRLAGGPASPAQKGLGEAHSPRRPSPAPRSAASPGLAGPGRSARTSRAGKRERRNVEENTDKRPGTPGPGIKDTDNHSVRLSHIVLQAWCCISLGVHRKVHIGRCLRKGGRRGFRRQQVPRMEYGLAEGTEPRQDCRNQVFLNNRLAA